MAEKHIIVVGAGAIGSTIAARLTQAGHNVTLVARNRRLHHLRAHPVELAYGDRIEHVRVQAAGWDDLAHKADICILCSKTCDLGAVLEAAADHLAPDGLAITLQNGVDAPEQAGLALPGAGIVAGRVHGFFEMTGNRICHVGVLPSVALGGTNPGGRAREQEAADVLGRAGFSASVSPNIVHDLWAKLMITACLGGVGAALGVAAGQVLAAPAGKALLRSALEEVVRLGCANGANLGGDDIERTLAFIGEFPTHATTSLQRDLIDGSRSEYDALVGAVIRLAARDRQPVPIFLELDARIRARFPMVAVPPADLPAQRA